MGAMAMLFTGSDLIGVKKPVLARMGPGVK
jgi:hypothetical protein